VGQGIKVEVIRKKKENPLPIVGAGPRGSKFQRRVPGENYPARFNVHSTSLGIVQLAGFEPLK